MEIKIKSTKIVSRFEKNGHFPVRISLRNKKLWQDSFHFDCSSAFSFFFSFEHIRDNYRNIVFYDWIKIRRALEKKLLEVTIISNFAFSLVRSLSVPFFKKKTFDYLRSLPAPISFNVVKSTFILKLFARFSRKICVSNKFWAYIFFEKCIGKNDSIQSRSRAFFYYFVTKKKMFWLKMIVSRLDTIIIMKQIFVFMVCKIWTHKIIL